MDYHQDHHLLLSGATDECRLWDLRTPSRGAALCIRYPGQGDVLSVLLEDSKRNGNETTATDEGSASPFSFPCTVYAAVGNKVYQHDLSHATTPILTYAEELQSSLLTAEDEINQIILSPDGSTLAAADDTGHIQWLRLQDNNQQHQVCHAADALTTAIYFSPRTKHMVSGGTDCTIKLWSYNNSSSSSSSRPPQLRRTVPPLTTKNDDNNTWCNPPMVHALAYNTTGDLIAAGLGDGSVGILQASSLTWMWHLEQAHGTSGVADVVWQGDQRLWSAGNDGQIVQWTVGSDDGDGDDDGLLQSPQRVFSMQHHVPKMNWLTITRRPQSGSTTLFVADTTHDITMYSISPIG